MALKTGIVGLPNVGQSADAHTALLMDSSC